MGRCGLSGSYNGTPVTVLLLVVIALPWTPPLSWSSASFGLAPASASAATSSSLAATVRATGSRCNYRYTASMSLNGNFSSPGYPGYRGPITCRYEFGNLPTGSSSGEEWRIRLRFIDFELGYQFEDAHSPFNCEEVDQVAVRFSDKSSQLFAVYCGSKIPPMLMSSGSWAEVMFGSRSAQFSGRGFRAEYSFVSDFGITSGEHNRSNGCWFKYNSSRSQSGTFTSPNHPGLYPRNIDCHYLFFGKPNQRVNIIFTDFTVEGVKTKCDESTQSDYVELSNDLINLPVDAASRRVAAAPSSTGRSSSIGAAPSRSVKTDQAPRTETVRSRTRICGDSLMANAFRSDSNFYHVTFRSNDVFDGTGFSAEYEFKTTSMNRNTDTIDDKFRNYYRQDNANDATSSSSCRCSAIIFALTSLSILMTNYN